MAAILCKTIGDLLTGCCRTLSKPCDCLCGACTRGCEELGQLFCTPFAPYLICTLALNTPAVVFAAKSLGGFSCSFLLAKWLVVNAAFALAHMFASFYIATIIQAPSTAGSAVSAEPVIPAITAKTGLNSAEATEEGRAAAATTVTTNFAPIPDDMPGGANSYKRVTHVLCYDKGMAIYILVFLAWVVWMGLGVSRRLFSEDYYADGGDGCGDDMVGYMSTALACGYVYMSLVSVAFCCSLLCLR